MHFFSKDTIDLGTGIDIAGNIKLSPFNRQTNQIVQSILNFDEFKHQIITEEQDYEKLRNFHFGFDLSKSIPISVNSAFNFGFDKCLKSNEKLMHAYRLILKTQLSLQDSSQLNDDAKELLLKSRTKFHQKYGEFYVASVAKGGAISVSAKISNDIIDNTDGIGMSTKLNDKISADFNWKNRKTSSELLSACVTATIGLETQFQSTDYNEILKEIEKLSDHIKDGSNIYYTINKYDLCSDYFNIQDGKSKFKHFIEQFDELHLEIQEKNLDFLKELLNFDQNSSMHSLKAQEIEAELRINDLQIHSNSLNFNRLVNDAVIYLKAKQFNSITLNSSDFTYELIRKSYGNDKYFDTILCFIQSITSLTQRLEAYLSFIDTLHTNKSFYTNKLTTLAYQVRTSFKDVQLNLMQNALYQSLKSLFPRCIQHLMWQTYFTITNRKFDKSLYITHDYFEYYTKDFKRAFIASNTFKNEFQWKIESYDNGKTFALVNKDTCEYLFLHEIHKHEHEHGKLIVMSRAQEATGWSFEPLDDDTLRISQNEYYLYGSNHTGIFRSDIFACSLSGDDFLINEHGTFSIGNGENLKRVTNL